jgi:hypothetical protein
MERSSFVSRSEWEFSVPCSKRRGLGFSFLCVCWSPSVRCASALRHETEVGDGGGNGEENGAYWAMVVMVVAIEGGVEVVCGSCDGKKAKRQARIDQRDDVPR